MNANEIKEISYNRHVAFQISGGSAQGYNYTIEINKTNEANEPLEGVVFEVVRDSTGGIVGEITTDANGKGKLTSLLQDNYTLNEISAPVGYKLKKDIKVTPEMFGTELFVVLNIVNKLDKISIPVSKVWDDANNQDGKRPQEITIRLLADNKEVESKTVSGDPWTWSFQYLPKYRDGGVEIKYTITEYAIEGYTPTIDGYNVTNAYTPEVTSVTVSKVWDNQDGIRPTEITVILVADGEMTNQTPRSMRLISSLVNSLISMNTKTVRK